MNAKLIWFTKLKPLPGILFVANRHLNIIKINETCLLCLNVITRLEIRLANHEVGVGSQSLRVTSASRSIAHCCHCQDRMETYVLLSFCTEAHNNRSAFFTLISLSKMMGVIDMYCTCLFIGNYQDIYCTGLKH